MVLRGQPLNTLQKKIGAKFLILSKLDTPRATVSNESKGIKISWKKISGAKKYEVYSRQGGDNWKKIKTTIATSFTDTGAKAGKYYTYRVKAVSGSVESKYKTTASICRLKASTSIKLTKATKGFKLTWGKVTGAKKYEVYRRTDSGSWKKIKTTTSRNYIDKTAKKGKYYTYRVRAVNGSSKSVFKTGKKTKR